MYADRDYLFTLAEEYNDTVFNGRLPYITFFPLHTYSLGGICTVDTGHYGEPYYLVGVSDYFDLTDRQVRQILLHELIHVYLHSTIGTEGLRHGRPFHREMDRVSRITGLDITVRADVDGPKRHNFIKAWLKTGREEIIGLPDEAFADMPPLYSTEPLTWYG